MHWRKMFHFVVLKTALQISDKIYIEVIWQMLNEKKNLVTKSWSSYTQYYFSEKCIN